MLDRCVVVTGIGAITPLGPTLAATIDALAADRSAVEPASIFDAGGFACADSAEIRDWDPRPSFRVPKALKLTDRPAWFAVAAARMALADARWNLDEEARQESLGVVIGSSGSDLQARDLAHAMAGDASGRIANDVPAFADRMLSRLNPLWLLVSLPNMTSAHVAIQVQARGPNSTIMTDWTAGLQAIGEAAEWIRSGEADAVLAGGADCGVQPFAYAAYQQAQYFNGDTHRFVPGEGAAVFLLESHDAAVARGATPYAELKSYASRANPDAHPGDALARTLCDAMSAARWTRESIAYCSVAAAPLPQADGVRDALDRMVGRVPSRTTFDTRLGYPLAAAGPIDAALMLAAGPGPRYLSSAVGRSGEAVTLAFEMGARA
jgi:3-oxoacyl-(acyl-carrier-protein) synthase